MEQQDNLPMFAWCKQKDNALVLSLHIQPGAKSNQIVAVVGDELKIKIAAPSIEDKANAELVRYMAALFKVPKSQIKIKRGLKSRHKIIEILDYDVAMISAIELLRSFASSA